jgi:hypothetical protein
MDRYTGNDVPAEVLKMPNSPKLSFPTTPGQVVSTWYVTRLALIFVRASDEVHVNGVCVIDPQDKSILQTLQILFPKAEDRVPGPIAEYATLGAILTEVFYIITYTWGVFLDGAARHIQALVSRPPLLGEPGLHTLMGPATVQGKKCVETELSSAQQLAYTRELHGIAPLWVEVRRRILAARDAAKQMTGHPFFAALDAQTSITSYLEKVIATLEDHLERTKELAEETNVIISLVSGNISGE